MKKRAQGKERKAIKSKKNEIERDALIGLALIAVIALLYLFAKPAITGLIVTESATRYWTMETPSEYLYTSSISLSNGEARLTSQSTIKNITPNLGDGEGENVTSSGGISLERIQTEDLEITGLSPEEYEVEELEVDDKYYTDRGYKIRAIPSALNNMLWVKTANDNKDEDINITFNIDSPARVYVGLDKRAASAPSWMSGWAFWGKGITASDNPSNPFNISYKDFPSGRVTLGQNPESAGSMYIVLINSTGYKKSGIFISEPIRANGTPSNIYWTASVPEGASISFQIRSAGTQEGLNNAAWHGPTSSSDFYTSPGENLNAEGQWVQYRAFLEGNKISSPVLSEVTISSVSSSYPLSAELQTYDFDLGIGVFSGTFNEISEGNLSYSYSADSGSSWTAIQNGTGINTTDISRIRFKAEFGSNGSATPVLYEMSFTYISCGESWEKANPPCLTNDSKLVFYNDKNGCGTSFNVPADNGTYTYCDYCTPNWLNANTSCNIDNTFSSWYYDSNDCYAKTGLSSDNNPPASSTSSCDYCSPDWSCDAYSECLSNNTKQCLNVTDLNSCFSKTALSSDRYSGNYSEFSASCVYDETAPELLSYSSEPLVPLLGGILKLSANISDKSAITATSTIKNIESNSLFNLSLPKTSGPVYSSLFNTSNLSEGVYEATFSAEDFYGNKAVYTKVILFSIVSPEKASASIFTNSLPLQANSTSVIRSTSTELGITSDESIPGAVVSIAEYTSFQKNATSAASAGKFIDIIMDNASKSNVASFQLKIYYTAEELSRSNIDEDTLKVYYYNESSSLWEPLQSFVNKSGKYVSANLSHTSTYGIFGEQRQQQPAQSSGGSSGGGGGGSLIYSPPEQKAVSGQNAVPAPAVKEKAQESAPKTAEFEKIPSSCNYSISIMMPNNISFADGEAAEGSIINTGSCKISLVRMQFSSPIKEIIETPDSYMRDLEKGKNVTFSLSANPQNNASARNLLVQGFAVKDIKASIKRYDGNFIVTAFEGEKAAAEENLSISIEFIPSALPAKRENGTAQALLLAGAFIFVSALLFFVMVRKRNKK